MILGHSQFDERALDHSQFERALDHLQLDHVVVKKSMIFIDFHCFSEKVRKSALLTVNCRSLSVRNKQMHFLTFRTFASYS